jgi:hypothetical protein
MAKRNIRIGGDEAIRKSSRLAAEEIPHRIETAQPGEKGKEDGTGFEMFRKFVGAGKLMPIAASMPGQPVVF